MLSGRTAPRVTVKPDGAITDFGFFVVTNCLTFVRTSGWMVTLPVVLPVVTAVPPEVVVVVVVEV
jgi:hypothetical protein